MKALLNKYKMFFFFVTTLFLVSCQNLGTYAITEQMLTRSLQSYLGKYSQHFKANDYLKMDLAFDKLDFNIGREIANKVVANGNATAKIQTPIGTQNVGLTLNLVGLPEFNKESNAVFLKQIEIKDYQINSNLGSLSNKAFLPYLNQALQLYFDNNPIYQIDKANSWEYLAFKSASYLKVEQGQLVFSMN